MRPVVRKAGWRMAIPLGECDAGELPDAVIRDTSRSLHVALVLVLVLRTVLIDAGLALGIQDLVRAVGPQLRRVYVPGTLPAVHRAGARARPGVARHRRRARTARATGDHRRARQRDRELALGPVDDDDLVLEAGSLEHDGPGLALLERQHVGAVEQLCAILVDLEARSVLGRHQNLYDLDLRRTVASLVGTAVIFHGDIRAVAAAGAARARQIGRASCRGRV